jgi:hypothetical protein
VAGELVALVAGAGGLASQDAADRATAVAALGSVVAAAPAAVFPHLLPVLRELLDRAAHSALTAQELDIYATPEGVRPGPPRAAACCLLPAPPA